MTKENRHVWISSRPLSRLNVHTRCNLGARYRWGIEGAFLVEKHQGYAYEDTFAKHWNAMKGYHYLMRLAHLLNTLARFSKPADGKRGTAHPQVDPISAAGHPFVRQRWGDGYYIEFVKRAPVI